MVGTARRLRRRYSGLDVRAFKFNAVHFVAGRCNGDVSYQPG